MCGLSSISGVSMAFHMTACFPHSDEFYQRESAIKGVNRSEQPSESEMTAQLKTTFILCLQSGREDQVKTQRIGDRCSSKSMEDAVWTAMLTRVTVRWTQL